MRIGNGVSYCRICHHIVASFERDWDKEAKCHVSCMKREERNRLQVLHIVGFLLLFALPAFGARELPPELSCKRTDDAHLTCEIAHYWGNWHPRWEARLADGRLAADEQARQFRPVIDQEWRTITASVGYDTDHKLVFEVEARVSPQTGRLEHRSKSGYRAVVVAYRPTVPGEQIAATQPP